ncbi:hypothetical protein ACFL3P_01465 [Pseudomonadota bacterium]
MEIIYIIITVIIAIALFIVIRAYIINLHKNPVKVLKTAQVYYDEMLYSQAKVTLQRGLKQTPNHPELIARLKQYEQEHPNKTVKQTG